MLVPSPETTKPCIYVICAASYELGELHGTWIRADQRIDDIHFEIDLLLRKSPSSYLKGWKIHSSHGFNNLLKGHESLPEIVQIAYTLTGSSRAFTAFTAWKGIKHATVEAFEESYRGEYESVEEFVEERYKALYSIPSVLDGYIDWSRIAENWFPSHFIAIKDVNGVHIFS